MVWVMTKGIVLRDNPKDNCMVSTTIHLRSNWKSNRSNNKSWAGGLLRLHCDASRAAGNGSTRWGFVLPPEDVGKNGSLFLFFGG